MNNPELELVGCGPMPESSQKVGIKMSVVGSNSLNSKHQGNSGITGKRQMSSKENNDGTGLS